LAIAQARIDSAKARLELAKVQLERTSVRAPGDGQVLAINIEPGEYVDPASLEAPLIMADTRQLRVRAFVEEFDAPRVTLEMTAHITCDGLPGEFAGRVSRVSPRMGAKEVWSDRPNERLDTKTREIWIDLEGAQNLVVGLRVDVMIHPPQHEAAPTPSSDPGFSLPLTGTPATPAAPHNL
jgi:hypothetical protein